MSGILVQALRYPHVRLMDRETEYSQVWGEFRSIGGAEGDRTPDLMTASHALSQLSYGPNRKLPINSGFRNRLRTSKSSPQARERQAALRIGDFSSIIDSVCSPLSARLLLS